MKLLNVDGNAKTIKGNKYGVLTGILYLAPADVSGYQVCPKASKGCTKTCLFTAGMGVYANVMQARINKTKRFFEERESFMLDLVSDAEKLLRGAKKRKLTPAIRLNGTSDIAWEKFKVIRGGIVYNNLFEAFPEISWYDYTKVLGRKSALKYTNYHLTFSLSEENASDAAQAINSGFNVAVVMNLKKNESKPAIWDGYPVIDGDISDIRFNDPKGGHIVALTAKGKARKDDTGFVRTIDSRLAA